jgi:hypothetical protein
MMLRPPACRGDELRALRRLQRESLASPFVFVTDLLQLRGGCGL